MTHVYMWITMWIQWIKYFSCVKTDIINILWISMWIAGKIADKLNKSILLCKAIIGLCKPRKRKNYYSELIYPIER